MTMMTLSELKTAIGLAERAGATGQTRVYVNGRTRLKKWLDGRIHSASYIAKVGYDGGDDDGAEDSFWLHFCSEEPQ